MAPHAGEPTAAERRERIAIWRELVVAHDRLMKKFQTELKSEFDLSVPQYDALWRLDQAPDNSLLMGEIAAALLYSSGAATKLFDRLVERGLVARSAAPNDRRAVIVSLTAEGLNLIGNARRTHGLSISKTLGPFASEAEQRHVAAFLARLATPPNDSKE
jgi:DNA-binding MarR family transcriptional regulator